MRLPRAVLLAALGALPARADVPPPAGWYEVQLARRAREAGHDCPDPARLEPTTKADQAAAAQRGRAARRIRCANGRGYLVSVPRHPPPRPGSPPGAPDFVLPLD